MVAASRHRAWSIVSNSITNEIIHDFIDANPKMKICGAVHDQDPGTNTHGHIFAFDSKTARTRAAMERKFNTPVIMEPFVSHPGEAGSNRGKYAMARAARYLTHEHPDQIELGKHRYPDDVVIANFNWRAEVDALNAYEGVKSKKVDMKLLTKKCEQKIIDGTFDPIDVMKSYPEVFGSRSPSHWFRLEEQGEKLRRRVDCHEQCAEQEQIRAYKRQITEQLVTSDDFESWIDGESPEGQAELREAFEEWKEWELDRRNKYEDPTPPDEQQRLVDSARYEIWEDIRRIRNRKFNRGKVW